MSLHLAPVTLADANRFVTGWHRHHGPVVGHKFSIGVADDGQVLRGVAIVGRPVARHYDDGLTLEVLRVATDGAHNAASMLYGACARAGFALGFGRIITYTQDIEPGTSLRAAGWKIIAQRSGRTGWDTPSRPRDNSSYVSVVRTLWEA